ncbi:iron-sulfur cluster repair di-iron protein [Ferroacidibacillus organovorans]|nr:iron-sulfur cluster repair di-iron protein [Ferroacidibacillus organovorans]
MMRDQAETMFTEDHRLGDIVVKFPQAGDIFKRYHIDFCCGGDQPLSEAIAEHSIDGSSLLKELNERYREAVRQGIEITDWSKASMEQLIHHIVNRHHAYLNKVFPPMSELTAKILRVHGENHGQVLSQVHRLFSQLRTDMEQHMIAEEQSVFLQIIDYEQIRTPGKLGAVIAAVEKLDQEHEATGDIVKMMRKVTDNYALPEDACATYAYVFEKLEELETDIFQHIHLENNILFNRLLNERLLPSE